MVEFVDLAKAPKPKKKTKADVVYPDFNSIIEQTNQETGQRMNISAAMETAPADAAQARKIGKQTGEPADLVLNNLATNKQAGKVNSAMNAGPVTREVIQEQLLASVFQNDIDSLSKTESIWSDIGGIAQGVGRGAFALPASYFKGQAGLGWKSDPVTSFLNEALRGGPAPELEAGVPVDERQMYKVGEAIEGASKYLFGERGADAGFGTTIAEGVGSIIPMIGASIVNPVIGYELGMGSQAGEAVERAIQKGASQDDIKLAAKLGSAVGLTEAASADVLVNRLMDKVPLPVAGKVLSFAMRVGLDALEEGGQEGLQQYLQNVIQHYVYDPKQALSEGVFESFLAGAAVGGVVSGPLQLVRGSEDAARLDQVANEIKKTDAATMAPDAVKQHGDALSDSHSGPDKLTVAPEVLTTLFQSEGDTWLEELPELDARLSEAQSLGTEVEITGGDYEVLAGHLSDEGIETLNDHIRTRSTNWTRAEINQEVERVQDQASEDMEAGQEIYELVTGQLEDAGYAPDIAADQAQVIAAFYETAAARSGVPVADIMQVVPVPAILSGELDTAGPEVINRRLSRELIDRTPAEPAPADLADFIIEQGGLRPHGDLAAMDADKFRRGIRRITSQRGIGLDAMRELAASAGFSVGESEASFLEAVRGVVAGTPLYPTGTDLSGYEAGLQRQERNQLIQDTLEQVDAIWGEAGPSGPMPEAAKREVINQVLNGVELADAVAAVAESPVSEIPTTLQQGDIEAQAESEGVTLDMSETDQAITLHRIQVPEQGEGVGSRYMQMLTEYADARGKRILLTPDTSFGATSRKRLVDFYKRFGFVENKGRNKDFTTQEGMIREPETTLLQTDTEPFQNWFQGSKVVDEDGNPLVVYHGTTVDFDAFDPSRANVEGDLGAGFYFTNNPEDVAPNYAAITGPDLQGRIERLAERLEYDEDLDPDVARERATAELATHEGATMPVYISMQNPVVIGGDQETNFDYQEGYDEETDEYTGEVEGSLVAVLEAIDYNAGDYGLDAGEIMGQIQELALDYGEVSASQIIDLKNQEPMMYAEHPQSGLMASGDFLRQVFKDAGYDGFIDNTVDKKFGSQRETGQSMAGMDPDTTHYIAFYPEQIKSASGNIGAFDPASANILEQGARGFIQFDEARSYFNITLTGKADLSTFLHESGHFFLEAMDLVSAMPEADPQQVQDFETIRDWLGAKPGEKFTTDQHEQWARGFEAYLREGKAPSQELRRAFMRFRSWLVNIYRTMRGLNVELNPDIRDVMDRMLATDEALASARSFVAAPDFMPQEGSGLTDEEYEQYRRALTNKRTAETEALQNKLMAQYQARIEKGWRDEVMDVAKRLREDIEQTDGWKAYAAIRALPRDERINSANLTKEQRAMLPNAAKGKDGLAADEIADEYGFDSGYEMIEAISIAYDEHRKAVAQAESIVEQRRGEILTAEQLADEALHLVHNDKMVDILLTELRGLAREAQSPFAQSNSSAVRAQIEDEAARVIGAQSSRELRPDRYRRAELKAAQEAATARARGDAEAAFLAKRRQLVNSIYYRTALNAKEDVQKIRSYLRPFRSKKRRAALGKKGPPDNRTRYLDQIDGLLDRVTFTNETLKSKKAKESFAQFLEGLEGNEEVFAVAEEEIAALENRNYRDLSINELRTLRDAVKNINHLANRRKKVMDDRKRRELGEVIDESTGNIIANQKKKKEYGWQNPTKRELFYERIRRARVSMLKPEFILGWWDGVEADGLLHRLIFQPLAKAQFARDDMINDLMKKIMTPMRKASKETKAKWNRKTRFMGTTMYGHEIIAAALNAGNLDNLTKLLRGMGWNEQQFWRELDAFMSKEDWDIVQNVWNEIDTLFDGLNKVNIEATGLPLPKVKAVPFETRHGTIQGGYYPIVYDPKKSSQADKHEEIAITNGQFKNNLLNPKARASAAHARVKGVVRPILLDLGVISRHVEETAHFITHYEAVEQANKILNNKKFRQVVQDQAGREYNAVLNDWLRDVANDKVPHQPHDLVTMSVNHLRAGASIAAMGYSIKTAAKQMLGIFTTIDALGLKYTMQGMWQTLPRDFTTNGGRIPVAQNWKEVREKSGEIRHLIKNQDRDIRLVIERGMGKQRMNWLQQIYGTAVDHAFDIMGYSQMVVNVATWQGAYAKGLDQGKTEKEAIQYADAIVRKTQSAGAMKDLSQIQRGHPVLKAFTMFMSFFNVLYNRFEDVARTFNYKQPHVFAGRMATLVMVPVVVEQLLFGVGDDEEEDYDPLSSAFFGMVDYSTGTIPILRNVSSALFGEYGFRITPIEKTLNDFVRGMGGFWDEGEMTESEVKALVTSLSTLAKLPSKPAMDTYKLMEWMDE